MGKSKSIQEQQKISKEFDQFIEEQNQAMDESLGKIKAEVDKMATAHTQGRTDAHLVIEGSYQHFTTMSEWSLDSVKKMTDLCSKAIFGAKPTENTEVKEVDEATKKSLSALTGRELLIANAAFGVIQGIMSGFSNKAEAAVEHKYEGKPISSGMTLFIGVENSTYNRKDFFTKDYIVKTIYHFKVFYSLNEGQEELTHNLLDLYCQQQADLTEALQGAFKQFLADTKLGKDNPDYITSREIYMLLKGELDELTNHIKNLGKENTDVIDLVRIDESNNLMQEIHRQAAIVQKDLLEARQYFAN